MPIAHSCSRAPVDIGPEFRRYELPMVDPLIVATDKHSQGQGRYEVHVNLSADRLKSKRPDDRAVCHTSARSSTLIGRGCARWNAKVQWTVIPLPRIVAWRAACSAMSTL